MSAFMQAWSFWLVVIGFAGMPLSLYIGLVKLFAGDIEPPVGCMIFAIVPLLAAPFIGWVVYHHVQVAWR